MIYLTPNLFQLAETPYNSKYCLNKLAGEKCGMSDSMQLLCSTGTFSRFPDLTDYRSILTYGPELEVDGFELMFYPDWAAEIEHIATELRKSGLQFPVVHAEKGIGPAFVSSQNEERAQGWKWMQASCQLGNLLGANLLIFHLWGFPDFDERIEQNLQHLADSITFAQKFGLALAVETVPCRMADPLSNVWRAIEQDHRSLVALDMEFLAMHNQLDMALETDWLWQQNRVRHIHIKDYERHMYSTDNLRRYLHPGEGRINFPQYFEALRQREFSGYISLESSVVNRDGTRDIQQLKKSLSLLRQLTDNL
jgi:sugar phosphate isomerase/epimerase